MISLQQCACAIVIWALWIPTTIKHAKYVVFCYSECDLLWLARKKMVACFCDLSSSSSIFVILCLRVLRVYELDLSFSIIWEKVMWENPGWLLGCGSMYPFLLLPLFFFSLWIQGARAFLGSPTSSLYSLYFPCGFEAPRNKRLLCFIFVDFQVISEYREIESMLMLHCLENSRLDWPLILLKFFPDI